MPRRPHRRKRRRSEKPPLQFLLDQFSLQDIEKAARFQDRFLRFHWDYYSTLAYQRAQIADDLRESLLEAAERSFPIPRWQRIIRYKWALNPLSAAGSLSDAGGRFNIGEIDPTNFPSFPAIYLAKDRPTALQEVLSQDISRAQEAEALDLALAKPDSVIFISLSGSLTSVINLKRPSSLERFVSLIGDFSLPGHLIQEAKAMGIAPPVLVRDTDMLLKALLEGNWRGWGMQVDVPAPSQIFGQLVAEAGVEAVLYPSKFGGNDCLAIFPKNFEGSDAFLQLDDTPPPGVQFPRLDRTTWQVLSNPP